MNLQWTFNIHVSTYHAAWCLTHYRDCCQPTSPGLQQAADELARYVDQTQVPGGRFWEQLLTLSASVDTSQSLAERLSVRLGHNSPQHSASLAAALRSCRREFEAAYPKYASDMPLRERPLRQVWEGHGAGLLRLVEKGMGESLVEHAQIVLVQPLLGGMGYAHLATNRIHLEAILTNADPRLPESLRVAWLLSQLDLERPVFSELLNTHRLRCVAGMATLPLVLHAGEELELCGCSQELLTAAIDLWRVDTLQLDASTAAAIVATWWETYAESRPTWRIALTGLDQMLR